MQDSPKGFEEYRPIRNIIRKYKREELLVATLERSLTTSRSSPADWSQGYLPWELLLLGRWIILDWNNIKGQTRVTLNNFNGIVNEIKKFSDRLDPFLGSNAVDNGLTKFARMMAFQQFWYQKDVYRDSISRAIRLFVLEDYSKQVDEALINTYGLTRTEIFDMFLMAWASFIDDKYISLTPGYFHTVYDTLGKEKTDRFFKEFSLSLDLEGLEQFNKKFPVKNYISEIHEKSPLYSKPFFKLINYHLWNKSFLIEFLDFGLYDIFKRIIPDRFGDDFGSKFERYIRERLEDHKISAIYEKELKKNGYDSQVDFLLETNDHLILVESKGIEATKRTKIYPTDEIMSSEYKKSVIKGLAQADYVNKKFLNGKREKTSYILIVTYKVNSSQAL